MKQWIAQRFKYVRALEERVYLTDKWNDDLERINKFLTEDVEVYRQKETRFSKMTLDEIESLLSSCVDYHEALRSLAAADPIQNRVLGILEKYKVKIVRNTVADEWKRSKRFNELIEEKHA